MKNRILISTGGSGGHVIPAIILNDHLSERNEVVIVSDKRGLKYLDSKNYKIEIIDTPKLNNIFMIPFNLTKIFLLTIKSFFLLKRQKINTVFSTGGYMSLPLILAGKFLNLKIYLLEPNFVIGRANMFFLKFCEKIFCYNQHLKNFPEIFNQKKVIISPLVRKEFYGNELIADNEKTRILIVGGSQGANIFDNSLKEIIVNLSKQFSIKVIQQTSEKNISFLKEFYSNNDIENEIFHYDKNFISRILNSDICITRAGATTLAELSILLKPFIAIPLPTSKDNHQLENAVFYAKNNCCWVLEQSIFEREIEELLRKIFQNHADFYKKKENLKKLNYQNTWINVNQKILDNINEN